MIPQGWKQERANDVCSQISVGIVVKPAAYYVEKTSGVRTFRSANVGEGFVKDKDWIYISDEGNRVNRKSVLRTNDVLIVRTGYPGTACLVPPEYEGSNCIDIIFARPKPDRIVPSYLCVFTNSEYGKKQVLDGQGGLAQQHFNVGAFKEIKIPLPPLPEQRRIAEVFSTWDRAIETVEALIANARTQKKALMQSLLTGKQRLPGFSGEWRDVALADVLSINRAKGKMVATNAQGLGLPYIGSTSFLGDFSKHTTANDALICRQEDILMLWDGEYAGKVTSGLEGVVSSTVARYRLDHRKADTDFIIAILQMCSERIRAIREGSGIPHMPGDFEHWFKFGLPPLDEQKAVATLFISNRSSTDKLQTQLTALRKEKSALMQQLLTGKRRMKVDEGLAA